MKHKVLAYIVRQNGGHAQLLVFEHRDFPEAGLQVPAGTVERGELPEGALYREIREEAGLEPQQLHLLRKLGEYPGEASAEAQTWHVYWLIAAGPLPDQWQHVVGGAGEDRDLVFEYAWADLAPGLQLAGIQGQWLPAIIEKYAS